MSERPRIFAAFSTSLLSNCPDDLVSTEEKSIERETQQGGMEYMHTFGVWHSGMNLIKSLPDITFMLLIEMTRSVSFIYSFIRSCVRSFVRSFVYSRMYLSMSLHTYVRMYECVCVRACVNMYDEFMYMYKKMCVWKYGCVYVEQLN